MKDGIIFTILLIVWTVIKLFFKLLWVIVKVLATLFIFFGLYIPLFYAVFGIVLLAATDFTLGVMGTDQILYYIGLGLCGVASIIISIRNLIVRPISAIFAPFLEYRDDVKKEREKFHKEDERQGESDVPRAPSAYDPYALYGQGGYPPYGQPYIGYAQQNQPYPPQNASQYPPQYPAEGQGYPYAPRRPYPYGGRGETPRDPYYGESSVDPAAPYYANGAPSNGYPPYYGGGAAPVPPMEPERKSDPYAPTSYPAQQERGFAPAPERPLIYYSKRRPGILVKEYSDRFELYDESDGTRRYIGTEYKDE